MRRVQVLEWEQAHKTRGSFRLSFLVSQPVTPGWTVALHSGWAAARRRRRWSSLLQVRMLQKKLARHDCVCMFKREMVLFLQMDGGCCAWAAALGLLHLAAGGPRGVHNLCKTQAIILRILL